jgi:hypothetical protein
MTTPNTHKSIEEMKKEVIRKLVDRFLGWQLPYDFKPDGGIFYSENEKTMAPIGTNLLTAVQAQQMFEKLLSTDLLESYAQQQVQEAVGSIEEIAKELMYQKTQLQYFDIYTDAYQEALNDIISTLKSKQLSKTLTQPQPNHLPDSKLE